MHFCSAITVSLLALSCSAAQASPRLRDAPPQPWLATAAHTRASVLARLAPKSKQPPYDRILLLLTRAQAELARPALADKRAAIEDANDAAIAAQTQGDYPLAADVFDGFLLAAARFAHPQPAYETSRQALLKAAYTAYQQAGREDRELLVLTTLRREAADDNTHDWACVQLAPLYVSRRQYAKAIIVLKEIRTAGMRGSAAYVPALEQKLKDSRKPKTPAPQIGHAQP